jgi:hypothetical protein
MNGPACSGPGGPRGLPWGPGDYLLPSPEPLSRQRPGFILLRSDGDTRSSSSPGLSGMSEKANKTKVLLTITALTMSNVNLIEENLF